MKFKLPLLLEVSLGFTVLVVGILLIGIVDAEATLVVDVELVGASVLAKYIL